MCIYIYKIHANMCINTFLYEHIYECIYLADEDAVAESSHADLVGALVHPHAATQRANLYSTYVRVVHLSRSTCHATSGRGNESTKSGNYDVGP